LAAAPFPHKAQDALWGPQRPLEDMVSFLVDESTSQQSELCSVPIVVCTKISHTLRRSSFSEKSHACFAYALASAGITAPQRYQLFSGMLLRRECIIFGRWSQSKEGVVKPHLLLIY